MSKLFLYIHTILLFFFSFFYKKKKKKSDNPICFPLINADTIIGSINYSQQSRWPAAQCRAARRAPECWEETVLACHRHHARACSGAAIAIDSTQEATSIIISQQQRRRLSLTCHPRASTRLIPISRSRRFTMDRRPRHRPRPRLPRRRRTVRIITSEQAVHARALL